MAEQTPEMGDIRGTKDDGNPDPSSGSPLQARKVGCLLGLGIALIPIIFAWLLLRKGHSTAARVIGFGWMGVNVLFSLMMLLVPVPPVSPDAATSASDGVAQSTSTSNADAASSTDDAKATPNDSVRPAPSPTPSRPALTEEQRKGFHCLNNWDGSHWDMQMAIARSLRNPDSFEHVETSISPIDSAGHHAIFMTYRAENGFGGMNVRQAIGTLNNRTCDLITLVL